MKDSLKSFLGSLINLKVTELLIVDKANPRAKVQTYKVCQLAAPIGFSCFIPSFLV